jgi:L-ascorbate metabolism protein UlaG (beta-lactamase superfamily)
MVNIKWLGHAAFLITAGSGVRIITDPYESGAYGGQISYGEILDKAEIVTISHDHGDHNYAQGIGGSPAVLKEPGSCQIKGVSFKGLPTYHDTAEGKERGKNIIFVIEIDGLKICHLGDLGHFLSANEMKELDKIDILLTPAGGRPATLEPLEVTQLAEQINPRIIIPMHFKTQKIGFPFRPLEDFLAGKERIKRLNTSELTISKENLPANTEIIVLQFAL